MEEFVHTRFVFVLVLQGTFIWNLRKPSRRVAKGFNTGCNDNGKHVCSWFLWDIIQKLKKSLVFIICFEGIKSMINVISRVEVIYVPYIIPSGKLRRTVAYHTQLTCMVLCHMFKY